MSNLDLARAVGLSPAATHARVRRLEERGVITGYAARVDAERAGFDLLCLISIGIQLHHQDAVARTRTALAALPNVLECHHLTGQFDYLLKVVAAGPAGARAVRRRAAHPAPGHRPDPDQRRARRGEGHPGAAHLTTSRPPRSPRDAAMTTATEPTGLDAWVARGEAMAAAEAERRVRARHPPVRHHRRPRGVRPRAAAANQGSLIEPAYLTPAQHFADSDELEAALGLPHAGVGLHADREPHHALPRGDTGAARDLRHGPRGIGAGRGLRDGRDPPGHQRPARRRPRAARRAHQPRGLRQVLRRDLHALLALRGGARDRGPLGRGPARHGGVRPGHRRRHPVPVHGGPVQPGARGGGHPGPRRASPTATACRCWSIPPWRRPRCCARSPWGPTS